MTPEAWPHWSIGNIAVRVHSSITVHAHISWWQLPSFNWVSMDTSATLGRSFHVRNAPHIVLLFVCLFMHSGGRGGRCWLKQTATVCLLMQSLAAGVCLSFLMYVYVRPAAWWFSYTIREAFFYLHLSLSSCFVLLRDDGKVMMRHFNFTDCNHIIQVVLLEGKKRYKTSWILYTDRQFVDITGCSQLVMSSYSFNLLTPLLSFWDVSQNGNKRRKWPQLSIFLKISQHI